jgi:hypothetical protein
VAAFQGYATGSCGRRGLVPREGGGMIDAGARDCFTWERLARGAGIAGATCWARPFLAPVDD